MVDGRPRDRIEPWLPRLRAELGDSASDEDLLLAAFYDADLLKPLKQPAPRYRFKTSPLHELIGYLGARADLSYARIRFAGTEMTVST